MSNDNSNEGNEEKGKIKKIKNHFRENRKFYIGLGTGVLGGIAIMAIKQKNVQTIIIQAHPLSVTNAISGSEQIKLYQRISMYGNALGRPGIPVIDETTGKRYESIQLAAHAIDAPRAQIDKQLRGSMDHVNGHKFAYAE